MKKLFSMCILIFTILLLGGCGEHKTQYTEEELLQMCIEDYVERNMPELTYDVKEKYETMEDTYLEIISLYVWEDEKELEVFYTFSYDEIHSDQITREHVENGNLEWDTVEASLHKENDRYQEILQANHIDALLQILDASNAEIHDKFGEIEDAIINEGFNHIAGIENERKQEDYQKMFWKCSTEFMREMYYALYPEEMLQGALDNIAPPVKEEAGERTKLFLQEIGEYETYAKEIEIYDDDEEMKPAEKEPEKEEPSEESEKEFPYDPYDVYDYWDPEDFYYDWEDDFDGYEDAEDYWYEAWDKVE